MTSPSAQKAGGEIEDRFTISVDGGEKFGRVEPWPTQQEIASIIQQAITEAVDAAVEQERAKYAGKVIEWRKQAWTGEGSEQYRMGRGHCADELESLVKEK